ncbi:MAG: glycosyltransferase family 2 protein [Planctomycetota bacterium]|nr:glycosyltransferase family 2 protein [Planctomycetota bacterium]
MVVLGKILVATYFAILGVLSLYGFHRYIMVALYYWYKRHGAKPKETFKELPLVTVQLPVFNEMYVVTRLLDAVCAMEYPRDRLQVQLLDDSIDETTQIAEAHVRSLVEKGHNVSFIHRNDRTGFKAGALEAGLKTATGEYVAIFDADFLPSRDLLMKLIHYFTDPKVGMVQARWGHVNRDFSLLTRVQSILLDGHFVIEHTARNRSGRFFNFNGTAGMWRKTCIEDAGGWHHDTLTEDLDLSYRAQLNGWQFIFLPEVVAPAEVPVEMNAFKSQQHRWAKGSVQVGLKILPRIWMSPIPLKTKIEATFHLTGNFAYLLMLLMSLILLPVTLMRGQLGFQLGWQADYYIDLALFIAATISVGMFYVVSQIEGHRDWWTRLKYFPLLISVGIGLSLNNSKAVLEALFGHDSSFVRTPKYNVGNAAEPPADNWKKKKYFGARSMMAYIEIFLGLYFCVSLYTAWQYGMYSSIPFLALFPLGFLYVGVLSLFQRRHVAA